MFCASRSGGVPAAKEKAPDCASIPVLLMAVQAEPKPDGMCRHREPLRRSAGMIRQFQELV